MPRDQRDSGDGGELAHESSDHGERLAVAAVDRDDHRVDATAPRDV
jgi:hypothetical protein